MRAAARVQRRARRLRELRGRRMAPGVYQSEWSTEEVRAFRKMVGEFIKRELLPQQARWRQQHYPDLEAWTRAGAQGLLLSDVPQQWGGGGGTFAHEAVVLEELARAGVHFGVSVQSIVAHYLLSYASDEQKRRWL